MPQTAAVDSVLIPLMCVQHRMPVDVDVARYIPASAYDVLITDIHESDMVDIGSVLGHTNLADALLDGGGEQFPVLGTIYGRNRRLFVPLTVAKLGKCAWCLFLIDTGSPYTYLCQDTLAALGYKESVPNLVSVKINGMNCEVAPSHGHFGNVNLLGQDFMHDARCKLYVDYSERSVRLDR